jgi:hypothetical protein
MQPEALSVSASFAESLKRKFINLSIFTSEARIRGFSAGRSIILQSASGGFTGTGEEDRSAVLRETVAEDPLSDAIWEIESHYVTCRLRP